MAASRPAFRQVSSLNGGETSTSYEMKSFPANGDLGPIAHEVPSSESDELSSRFKSTYEDNKDMYRLGKKQELRRNFRFLSIWGYSLILGSGWVLALIGAISPLLNGGTAGGIYGYFIVMVGLVFTTLSMAEMASMAPTAGGQYHWVSEFAPPSAQKILSYLTGWLCVLGWQTALCSTSYSGALAVQGIIAINMPGYVPPAWQGVILTIGIVLSTIFFNTILLRKLPTFEGIMVIFHIAAFIAVLTVMWVMGDRTPASQVFTEFSDFSGWGSNGLAMMVGTLAASGSLLGSDCAAHLAEEVQDASWILPRSMIATAVANYGFCMIMVITFMTVKGAEVEDLLPPEVEYQSYIRIFENVTQSRGGATALTSLILVLLLFAIINQVTTTSRQLYAFARDGGLPGSKWLSHVRPGWDVPLNAVSVTLLFSILVSFIILGSPVAFFTLGSLCQSGLYASYLVVIGCIAYRRISGGPLPPTRFSLGKASLPVNLIAMVFLSVQLIFIFFPTAPNPTPDFFNWSILIFFGVMGLSLVWYFYRGRHEYQGPVEYVRKGE